MKYEMEQAEAMEELEEQELQRNLEMEPPKLENNGKKEEMPPKMERGNVLGGSIMEASIEARKAELERLKDQLATERAKVGDMTLGESRDAFNKRKAMEASTNRIQAEHRARDYVKQLREDERKKQEYRESLYGKDK